MSMAECNMRQFDVFLFRGADWGHYTCNDSGVMPLHVACGFRPERTCPKVIECAAFILDQLKAAADAFAEDESLDLPPGAFRNATATCEKPKRASPSRFGTVVRVLTAGSQLPRRLARIPACRDLHARARLEQRRASEYARFGGCRSRANRARGHG